jgi:hypothetical protein
MMAQLAPLVDLPRGPTGLPNIAGVPEDLIAMARGLALAMQSADDAAPEPERPAPESSLPDAQCQLFGLFEELYVAMVGTSSETVQSIEQIGERIAYVLGSGGAGPTEARDRYNNVVDRLAEFYQRNASDTFAVAKQLGGVKSVAGGQRAFVSSTLTATRIAGLYCDTQLIPDPIYPFFAGKLNLNAARLQMALALYYVLQLRPLVDARLPEPPVVVFPSFEQPLDEGDATTMAGQASLLVKVVAPVLGAEINSPEELYEFAARHEEAFCAAVMRERLFVPPGADPNARLEPAQAAAMYLESQHGVRSASHVAKMKQFSLGQLLMLGIQERLRPQYHLFENADELDAQPLLHQAAHWHYFELCANADASELVREQILTPDAFDVLRALQDDSLSWLANIPVAGLAELRLNREHAQLRDELRKCTAQLVAAGRADLSDVTREVNHGLQVLIQRQQAALREIEKKYSPKVWGIGAAAVGGAVGAASLLFLPALATAVGVAAPLASALGAIGTGLPAYVRERAAQLAEKRQARKSLIGMLATARSAG